MADKAKHGLVMVYTGDGKGKTTAALGLVLRAVGHGFRAKIIQFMKGDESYGEVQAVRSYLPGVELEQHGLPTFVDPNSPAREDLELSARGMEAARAAVESGEYDLVVLDEINVAVSFGLVPEGAVLDLLEKRPTWVDLVLTGRGATRRVMEAADMVSEVKEIKHHYQAGVEARAGIEY